MAVEAENMCFENMGFGPYAICSSQEFFMASVLGIEDGFCFQELEHPNDQQRKVLNPLVDYSDNLASASASSSFACFGSLPVQIMQSLSSELEKQRLEMDWFLQMENKRLRRSILEEDTRQKALLMRKYESRIKILMLQKDEELAFARNKTRELQDFLTRAEMEAKAWEKKATEKEAIVSDLNNRLNQVKMKDDDAVSFCDSSSSSSSSGERSGKKMMKGCCCKLCQARSLCVVFFPCRHLCCCKSCEPLLGQCPVCQTVKEASLEVFLG